MKNLFNNISESEKNRILEMHTNLKNVISEDEKPKTYDRRDKADTNEGIKKIKEQIAYHKKELSRFEKMLEEFEAKRKNWLKPKKTVKEEESRNVRDMSDMELSNTFVDHIGGRFNPDTESEEDFMDKRFATGIKSYMDTDFAKERNRRGEIKRAEMDAQPKRLPDDIQDRLYRKHKMMYNQHDNHQDWEDAFSAGIHKVKDESDKYRENPDYDFGFED